MCFIITGALISFLSKLNFLEMSLFTRSVGEFNILVERTRLWVVCEEEYKGGEEEEYPHVIVRGEN